MSVDWLSFALGMVTLAVLQAIPLLIIIWRDIRQLDEAGEPY
jgi:hypothetical protein